MKYGWSNKDLQRRLRILEIESHQVSTSNVQLVIDIAKLKFILEENCLNNEENGCETENMSERLDNIKFDFIGLNYLWNDCIRFGENTHDLGHNYPLKRLDFTKDEIFGIVHDFYRDMFNKQIFDVFDKAFQEREKHVRFIDKSTGMTLYLKTLEEYFIQTAYTHTFDDLGIITHEYGHVIHYRTNYNQQTGQSVTSEIFSTFSEQLFLKWAIDNKIYENEAIKYKALNWTNHIETAHKLKNLLKVLKIPNYNNAKHLKRLAQQKYGFSNLEFDNILDDGLIDFYPYIIGLFTSIELLYMYQNNPENTIDLVWQILTSPQENHLLYKYMKDYGLTSQEHVGSYESQLKRELKRINK